MADPLEITQWKGRMLGAPRKASWPSFLIPDFPSSKPSQDVSCPKLREELAFATKRPDRCTSAAGIKFERKSAAAGLLQHFYLSTFIKIALVDLVAILYIRPHISFTPCSYHSDTPYLPPR